MYTLYEIAFKGTEDRLYLTESKEDAIRKRAELRAEYAAAGCKENIVARRVYTLDYWVCEGKVFDDVADLYEAYQYVNVPAVQHTTTEDGEPKIIYTTTSEATRRFAHGYVERLAKELAEAALSDDLSVRAAAVHLAAEAAVTSDPVGLAARVAEVASKAYDSMPVNLPEKEESSASSSPSTKQRTSTSSDRPFVPCPKRKTERDNIIRLRD